MNGFYIIILVFFVSIFYLWKYIKQKKNAEMIIYDAWKQYGFYFKWGSVILCNLSTFILLVQVYYFSHKAQEGLGIIFTFVFYIVPTIFLVVISIIFHIKYNLCEKVGVGHKWFSPFLVYALCTVTLPFIIFSYFRVFVQY